MRETGFFAHIVRVNYDQIIHEKEQKILDLKDENMQLKERIAWFERQIFGQKSERFIPLNPEQLAIDLNLEQAGVLAEAPKEVITYERKKATSSAKPTGRQPWPDHLPRVDVVISPPVDDPENYVEIGQDITEELEYIPQKLFVRRLIRPRWVRKESMLPEKGETTPAAIVQAPAVVRPMPRLSAGTALLAAMICDKYLDHLPLHRQLERFNRMGVRIAKATASGWIMEVCRLLQPLFEANRRRLLQASYLQVDETRIQVLNTDVTNRKTGKTGKKAPPPGKSHRGYYWVFFDPLSGLSLFDYHPGRGGEYPQAILNGYSGHIQTDGYAVYEAFDKKPGITLFGCMAHVRRKFVEAQDGSYPKEAKRTLRYIQLLYYIEAWARQRMALATSPETAAAMRLELRQRRAKPLFEAWIKELEQLAPDPKILPKSNFGKAISYALKRAPYLRRYLDNPYVEIDNNLVENAIRPVALGRKNYLFAGSDEAATNAGNLYSLLAAAKYHGLNPPNYLFDVIESVSEHPINRIEELLPHKWTPNPNLPAWLSLKPQ